MSPVALGKPVPAFSIPSSDGSLFCSDQLSGNWTVLYFYPKDNTPGCTQEAQDFNGLKHSFDEINAKLIGVSRDSLKSHDNFKCKYQLDFDLFSDADETLCTLFEVIKLKNMYGKQVRGIERSTFLINPDGILTKEWRKVTVKGHAQKVLETLQALQGQ